MFRLITPIILIAISLTGFFLLTSPIYEEISALRGQTASYNEALDNSKALENERDKLTSKFNSIDPEDLEKLQKLLPNNVDNIRLILEIERLATPYGMVLKNVKYETTAEEKEALADPGAIQATPLASNKEYGVWTLGFSTQSTYRNFLNFIRDLENNLRIVDIALIEFSSNTGGGITPSLSDTYEFSFQIKTYWLKN